jgi:hypothetical protein
MLANLPFRVGTTRKATTYCKCQAPCACINKHIEYLLFAEFIVSTRVSFSPKAGEAVYISSYCSFIFLDLVRHFTGEVGVLSGIEMLLLLSSVEI